MDKYEKLKELKSLLDKGLLNQDEFNKLKNEILFADNGSKNTNVERNKLEEIAYKNNSKSNIENPSKNKNYSSLIFFVVFFAVLIFFAKFNISDNSEETTIDSTATSTESIQIENNSTTCKICGKIFSGDGYDEIDGIWQRNPDIQTEICSPDCGRIEAKRVEEKYNTILEKHGYKAIDFNQSSNSNHAQPNSNGYFTGSDGQLHQVSPCGNCHHTGFIDMGDGMQVCPMCNGKGEVIH